MTMINLIAQCRAQASYVGRSIRKRRFTRRDLPEDQTVVSPRPHKWLPYNLCHADLSHSSGEHSSTCYTVGEMMVFLDTQVRWEQKDHGHASRKALARVQRIITR